MEFTLKPDFTIHLIILTIFFTNITNLHPLEPLDFFLINIMMNFCFFGRGFMKSVYSILLLSVNLFFLDITLVLVLHELTDKNYTWLCASCYNKLLKKLTTKLSYMFQYTIKPWLWDSVTGKLEKIWLS